MDLYYVPNVYHGIFANLQVSSLLLNRAPSDRPSTGPARPFAATWWRETWRDRFPPEYLRVPDRQQPLHCRAPRFGTRPEGTRDPASDFFILQPSHAILCQEEPPPPQPTGAGAA